MLRTTVSPIARRALARSSNGSLRPCQIQNTPLRTFAQRAFSNTSICAHPKPSTNFTFSSRSYSSPRRSSPPTLLQRLRSSIRFFSSSRARLNGEPSPNVTPKLGSPGGAAPEPTTLRGRMRKLSREYGWTVVGVYAALSILDFPFCFLLVRTAGTDRVGQWEDFVVSHAKALVPEKIKETWRDWRKEMRKKELEITGDDDFSETLEMATWGVEEANAANKRDASLATQLALAYAIHKSFIFLRVPLTAAVTPKVVKTLRGWGWDIGKRTTKEAKALKRAASSTK